MKTNFQRNNHGAMFPLIIFAIFLAILFGIGVVNYCSILRCQALIQSAAEAGALAGARDISRIVVDDPALGYISVSDQLAAGNELVAPDGDPLPVRSYNTLMATARLDAYIAKQVGLSDMRVLAKRDAERVAAASEQFSERLQNSLKGKNSTRFFDKFLLPVDVNSTVSEAVKKNLVEYPFYKLDHVECQLGCLKTSGQTVTHVPIDDTQIPKNAQASGNFKAGVNASFDGQSYMFMPVSDAVRLADSHDFVKQNVAASALRVQITCVVHPLVRVGFADSFQLVGTACAVPAAGTDKSPVGDLLVNIVRPLNANCESIYALLQVGKKSSNTDLVEVAQGGDFPTDRSATLQKVESEDSGYDPVELSLYCWIRNLGPTVRTNSLRDALFQRLNDTPGFAPSSVIFQKNQDGFITLSRLKTAPFAIGCVADGQMYCARTLDSGNQLHIYNEVLRDKNFNHSKHGGQPLCSDPVNWCELPEWGRSESTAFATGRGQRYLNIALLQDCSQEKTKGLFSCHVQGADGKALALRKSLVSGGLACDIDLN